MLNRYWRLLVLSALGWALEGCGAKSDSHGACGAQGQSCCGSWQCEADAGLACDNGNVCALASPAAQGQTCVTNGDCQSNVCTTIGDHPACTATCSSTADCGVEGWACDVGPDLARGWGPKRLSAYSTMPQVSSARSSSSGISSSPVPPTSGIARAKATCSSVRARES